MVSIRGVGGIVPIGRRVGTRRIAERFVAPHCITEIDLAVDDASRHRRDNLLSAQIGFGFIPGARQQQDVS
jgi:hypothetical protein